MSRDAAARPRRALWAAFAAYLALSVLLWWHVWSSHPSAVTLCGCEDPSLSVWYLAWPAYALAHAHDPFFSTALFHPSGVNLLSNTGMLALGVPLAPVTWLFGPVATLNVASTLGPALSAVSMCWLLRRWVAWTPAAFVGGLLFGFSPFVFANLAVAHLNLVVLAVVPLIVGGLDELCVRQRRPPLVAGAALGFAVVVQFFVSTEVLVIVALFCAAGLVLAVAAAAVSHPSELSRRAPHAARGLLATAAVAAVLLAYPLWFALDGPAHLSGLVWPGSTGGSGVVGAGPIVPGDLLALRHMPTDALRFFAGYQGPALPEPDFLGAGLVVVAGAGLAARWRDGRLWLLAALAALAVAVGLGRQRYWTPWRALGAVPVVQNVVPGRLMVVVTFCGAAMVAVSVGSLGDWVRRRSAGRRPGAAAAPLAALALAALAVVPVGVAEATNVPLTTESVAVPRWFSEVAPHLPAHRVLLTFPPPATGGSAMTWQAVDGLRFAMATGAGPGSIPSRAGPERAGQVVLADAASLFGSLAPPTPTTVGAVRRALAGWGVTDIVVPVPSELVPPADRDAATAWALGIFTLAVGRPPAFSHDAWVWSALRTPSPRRSVGQGAFAACTAPQVLSARPPLAVPACVLAASRPG